MQTRESIAIFSEDYPPCSGGIAQWALGIAEQLHRWYHPVLIYTKRRRNNVPQKPANPAMKLYQMCGRDWKKYHKFYTYYYAGALLRKRDVAAIITTTWDLAEGICGYKKKYDFRLVPVLHGLEVTRKLPRKVIGKMERTLQRVDWSVAVSEFTKRRVLDRIPLDPDKIEVLPNGVSTGRFFPVSDPIAVKKKFNLSADTKVILTLARVVERKGHDTVIETLPEILRQFPNTVYVIAGPWRQWVYEDLRRLVSRLNLQEKVMFTGRIEDEKLNDIYNIADVYVMVSKELKAQGDVEGFGITFLEANACGKPVIGSYSGGIPEAVIDGRTGFLVQPGDAAHLTQRILEIFSNPALARNLGDNGRRRVQEELTWEHIAERLAAQLAEQ